MEARHALQSGKILSSEKESSYLDCTNSFLIIRHHGPSKTS